MMKMGNAKMTPTTTQIDLLYWSYPARRMPDASRWAPNSVISRSMSHQIP